MIARIGITVFIVGLLLVAHFRLAPPAPPPTPTSAATGAVVEREEEKRPAPVPVTIRKRSRDVLPESQTSRPPVDGGEDDFTMPYIQGNAGDPNGYLRLILARGGDLLLTRGARFQPVAMLVTAATGELAVATLPPDYRVPHVSARDVTDNVLLLLGGHLPEGATRILLFWPAQMQEQLGQRLRASPLSKSAELEAEYQVDGDRLVIRLKAPSKDGGIRNATDDYTIIL